MHVAFALFADAANLSQEGKLNILGVFDALQVGTLPALHPRATLVVHLKGTPADVGTHRVSLEWLSPGGNELWSSEGELGIAAPPPGVAQSGIVISDLPGGLRIVQRFAKFLEDPHRTGGISFDGVGVA